MRNCKRVMKANISLLTIAAISLVLTGCSSDFYHDSVTGDYKLQPGSEMSVSIFTDSVNDDIKRELKSKQFPDGVNWHDYWINRCESLYYDPHLGDSYIQYIINKRREAGLPDITEIDKRQFKSEWQIFTDNVNRQTDRETQGFPPPYSTNRSEVAWSAYWKMINEQALNNSSLSTNGVEYINGHRKQAGLPPLN